jgi:hypothetical protein
VYRNSFKFDNLRTSTQKISFFDASFERLFERFAVVAAAVFSGRGLRAGTAIPGSGGPQLDVLALNRALRTPAKLLFLQATFDVRHIDEQRAVIDAACPRFRDRFC